MLGMLVGHAGDVENDAGYVDGLVENTLISTKCGKLRYVTGPDEEQTKKRTRTQHTKIRTQIGREALENNIEAQ